MHAQTLPLQYIYKYVSFLVENCHVGFAEGGRPFF